MRRIVPLGFVLGLAALTNTASLAENAKPAQKTALPAAVTAPAAVARPLHAVLRYDATTAAACRSFSDASSEVCLLLALHVIRMSEQPLAGRAL